LTDHTLSVLFKGCDNYYRKLNYRKLKQTQTLTGFIRFSIRDLVFRVRVWIGLVVGSLVFVNYHSPCLMVILVTQHKKTLWWENKCRYWWHSCTRANDMHIRQTSSLFAAELTQCEYVISVISVCMFTHKFTTIHFIT